MGNRGDGEGERQKETISGFGAQTFVVACEAVLFNALHGTCQDRDV